MVTLHRGAPSGRPDETRGSTERLATPEPPTRKSAAEILVLAPYGLETDGLDSILTIAGFELRLQSPETTTGAEIVERQPALVICLLDGSDRPFEILEEVQASLASNSPPFLAIASCDDDGEIERAFTAGMRDVVSRPIAPSLLRVKVQRLARRTAAPTLAIAGYSVKQVLGRGGMGTVYLAHKRGIPVALKVLDVSMQQIEPEALTRFKREVDALRSLRGSAIPRFFEAGRIEDCFYLAMEYVPGRTVAQLGAERPLPENRVVRIADAVAGALETIHQVGLVHRDVKPANVIVTPTGDAKLVDFGLVKLTNDRSLTRRDEVMGTVPYMAPELLRGAAAAPPTDAFALGMTILEALMGRCPVEGRNFDVAMARVRGEVPNPFRFLAGTVSPGLLSLIDGLVAPDPLRRLTIAQTRERLSRLLG